MWTVSKAEIAGLLKLDLLARLREAKEKTTLFEDTHQQAFEEFERMTLRGAEDFTQWEEYIEWKAYRKMEQEIEEKVEALNHGDFEVA